MSQIEALKTREGARRLSDAIRKVNRQLGTALIDERDKASRPSASDKGTQSSPLVLINLGSNGVEALFSTPKSQLTTTEIISRLPIRLSFQFVAGTMW